MNTESLLIDGPVGLLELLVERSTATPTAIGIVCHPHPLFEGTMHNKVAYMLARSFKDANMLAIRFNFRGVGKRDGIHDDGQGEVDDVLAVIAWARAQWPDLAINLAGFSFGAYVALQTAQEGLLADTLKINTLITVAPPVGRWDFSGINKPNMPCLIIQGLEDELVDANEVIEWSKSFIEAPHVVEVPEADHFFHGKLNVLRDAVNAWLVDTTNNQ